MRTFAWQVKNLVVLQNYVASGVGKACHKAAVGDRPQMFIWPVAGVEFIEIIAALPTFKGKSE